MEVTRLPRGATGFRDHGTQPLPLTDARLFASACYEAARHIRGRVLEITPPGVTPNFHTAAMTYGELTVGVLAHMHLPFIAIAQMPAGRVVFTHNCGDLQDALRSWAPSES